MCGLFGWTLRDGGVDRYGSRKRAFRSLAWSNDLRGGHSYGAYLIDRAVIYRGLGSLSRAKWPKKDPRPESSSQMMAHTRYATHGGVTRSNAHPFVRGNITGAHNGIIFNHDELNKKYKRDLQVDSQHIFQHISEGRPLDDLEGYGTIEYVDANEPGRIYIGTFNGDLAVARLARGQGIVWSSDDDHLKDALKAAGWPFEMLKIENRALYMVQDGEVYETGKKIEVSQRFAMSSGASSIGASSWLKNRMLEGRSGLWDWDEEQFGNGDVPRDEDEPVDDDEEAEQKLYGGLDDDEWYALMKKWQQEGVGNDGEGGSN